MKKTLWCAICFALLIVFGGCSETVHINTDKNGEAVVMPVPAESIDPGPKDVRIMFRIMAEFPEGSIRPDIVSMDGRVIEEDSTITTGSHSFVIEKRGYQKTTSTVLVDDPERDGIFHLSLKMETKERLIIFDIRDKADGKILKPDQVVMLAIGEEQQQKTIADKAYVKPGRKKVVIQKSGYVPLPQEITIDPDEEP